MDEILYLYVPITDEEDGRESSYSSEEPTESMKQECSYDQARLFMVEDGIFHEWIPAGEDAGEWEEMARLHS